MEKINAIVISALIWCCVLLGMGAVHYHVWDYFIPSTIASDSHEEDLASLDLNEIDTLLLEVDAIEDTLAGADSTANVATVAVAVQEATVEPTHGLDAFYASLATVGSKSVRVVHYGDSQIEEDRITSVLRQHLQAEYGGNGLGLIPLHQTIPTRTLKQRVHMNGIEQPIGGGPKRYMIYGPKSLRRDTCLYGPMGQVAIMNDSLVPGSEDLAMEITPLSYPGIPASVHSHIRLLADSGITMFTDTLGMLHLTGRGAVYGLSLEGKNGVYVDNIPMRGSLGTIFTGIDSRQLHDYYTATNTRLIILQYGGNFIAGTHTEEGIRNAVYALRLQVRHLQKIAPEASILFIGPSDMLINDEGVFKTNPFVPLMDRLLRQMAEKTHIAYFSLFQAMGGENSMIHWQEIGLAGKDGIHFTRRGADKAGEALWKWIKQMQPAIEESEESLEAELENIENTDRTLTTECPPVEAVGTASAEEGIYRRETEE